VSTPRSDRFFEFALAFSEQQKWSFWLNLPTKIFFKRDGPRRFRSGVTRVPVEAN
jgi:hypothetical protein